MTGPRQAKYTCGNCYTEFDFPDDGRCPTCKVREIVPMGMSDSNDEGGSVALTYGDFIRAFDLNIELLKRVEELETILNIAKSHIHAGNAGFALHDINRYFREKEKPNEQN